VRISIETKHYVISAIVALALTTIASLTWYRSQSINEMHSQREAIHHFDISLRMLHEIHLNFVTLHEPKYLNAFRASYKNIKTDIEKVAANMAKFDLNDNLFLQLLKELSAYKQFFEKLATLQQKIGKDQTEGIRKNMRDALYAIESILEGVSDQNIRYAIHRRVLMTQRPEKDLMLRRQDKYLVKFDNYYALTTADVENFIDDPEQKSQLLSALEKYKDFFRLLSKAALEVGLTYNAGLRLKASTLINGTHDTVDKLSDYVNAAILKKESEVNTLIFLFCVAFSAIIILLIFLLTRSIVHPLQEVTSAMTALANGDYDIKLSDYNRDDEIGVMAQTLKIFKGNAIERDLAKKELQKAHNELEQRVEERTSELMGANRSLAESQRKAEAASIAKGNFLSTMSHELRTPLNAIIGFSSSMKSEVFGSIGNDKYREYLDDIHLSGRHLLDLINDILDVSAIEANAIELHEENTSLVNVVGSSVNLIQPRAEEGQVTVTSSIDPEIPLLWVDERRVKQVLLNLLSNAVKFTNEGGKVTVSARLNDDGSVAVWVADNGIGMNEEEARTALSRFGQVDTGLDRKHEGTGLGLPLTKDLMELHGGTLEIESEKGYGTSVTVIFPKQRVVEKVS
jgi:signal transduction histidine kinase